MPEKPRPPFKLDSNLPSTAAAQEAFFKLAESGASLTPVKDAINEERVNKILFGKKTKKKKPAK